MKKLYLFLLIAFFVVGVFFTALGSHPRSFVVFKFLIFVCLSFTLYRGLCRDKDLLSPFTLFSTYPLSLLLYSDYISSAFLPIPSISGMAVHVISVVSTLCGMLLARVLFNKKRYMQKTEFCREYYNLPAIVLFLIPLIVAIQTIGRYNIDSAEDVANVRSGGSIAILGALYSFNTLALINGIKSKKYWSVLILTSVIALSSFINMSKGTIINIMLVLFFAQGLYHKETFQRLNAKKIIFIGLFVWIALAGSFYFIGRLRSGKWNERDEDYLTGYEYAVKYNRVGYIPPKLRSFFGVYMYMVTPATNVDYLVENNIHGRKFSNTLWPFLSVFQIKRIFNIQREEVPVRHFAYNTFSFSGFFFFDGGIPLVIAGCFIIGFLTYFVYQRMLKNMDVICAAEYFAWGVALFYTFFSNHFLTQCYPLRNVLLFEIYRFFFLKNRNNNPKIMSYSERGKNDMFTKTGSKDF